MIDVHLILLIQTKMFLFISLSENKKEPSEEIMPCNTASLRVVQMQIKQVYRKINCV